MGEPKCGLCGSDLMNGMFHHCRPVVVGPLPPDDRDTKIRELELQLGEAKKLLAKIEEQGLHHECAMEGHISKYGCDQCKAATEQEILKFLGLSVGELPCCCGFCGTPKASMSSPCSKCDQK